MDNTILTLILFLEMGEVFKMTLSRRTQPEVSKQHYILQGEQLKYGKFLSKVTGGKKLCNKALY